MAYSVGNRQVGWGALSACYDCGKEPAMCVARAGRGGGAENGNCNFFCPRRAAKNTFFPRRTRTTATETSELQRQNLLSTKGREGPRRTTKNCNGNFRNGNCNTFCPRRAAKGHEGPRRTAAATSGTATATPFVHGGHRGPRRATENGNCNTFCPRRTAKGREGPRRTARATPFVHEGPRRTPFFH